MAKLAAARDVAEQQYRHALAERGLERRVGVDVELDERRLSLRDERRKRRAHVVAEMTVRADEKRQPDRGVPCGLLRVALSEDRR